MARWSAVFCIGHANAEVNAAICRQLDSIAYAYRYLFTSARSNR